MICTQIVWIVKEKIVYNVLTGAMEVMRFLRLNLIDDYNNDMGHVDVSDQLRNQYRFDHWMRNRKWWWVIYFWALGVVFVNAYIIYVAVMIEAGQTKQLLSHHDFRAAVAIEW